MMQVHYRDAVALSARTLGALFSFSPDSAQAAPLVAALRDGSWQAQWPFPLAESLVAGFAAASDEALPQAWQRLFIGPWALPAPPWGSVWLDKENVLFGDSTLALREWMRANGIAHAAQSQEPEDHFGTLLLLAAWLCESGQEEAFSQLLAWHLLPGPAGSLRCLSPGPDTPFINPSQSWRRRRSPSGSASFRLPSPTSRCIAKRIAMPGNGHGIFSDNVTQPVFISAFSSPRSFAAQAFIAFASKLISHHNKSMFPANDRNQ
jgi:TorA maturation chaperone TorD